MPITKYLPLGISDYWLGSSLITCSAMLLRSDVTSIPETVLSYSDLNTYEISTGGGYTAGSAGVAGTSLNRVQDATSGVVEYHCGSQYWQSSTNLTVTYRWIVLVTSTPIVVFDTGTSTSLSGGPLTLQFTESPYEAGIYPILRFKRNTA